ncbi:MAG: type IV pilus biogenesis/stability protein PilW [Gammaproteobacteria bacterium]
MSYGYIKCTGALVLLCLLSACETPGGVREDPNDQISTEVRSTDKLAEINTQLGVEYMKEGNFETALKKLKKAIDIDSNYARAYDVLGLLYTQLGQANDAESNFKRALELAPKDSSILNNYGQFLCSQGKANEGQELFAKAVKNPLYTTPEFAFMNAATCAAEVQHDTKAAKEFLRQALEKNPKMPPALFRMSKVNYEAQDYMSAKAYYERFTQVAEQNAESLWLGIQIEQKLGDQQSADNYAMMLRGKFPDSAEAAKLSNGQGQP